MKIASIFHMTLLLFTVFILGKHTKEASAAACSPISGSGDVIVSTTCSALEITSGGNIEISTDVTINDATAPSSYHSVKINAGNTTSFSNYGVITESISVGDLWNAGSLGALSNSGTISASGTNNHNIMNTGSISTLTNYGNISITGSNTQGIFNYGIGSSIINLTNSGNITVGSAASSGVKNEGTITNLSNTGTIQAGTESEAIHNSGSITNISNSGNLLAGHDAIVINNSGTIGNLINTGTIIGTDFSGIYNTGDIGVLTNNGVISNSNDIYNGGTIGTLNNAQSGLTYSGQLPTNYNIMLNGSNYGSLIASSPGVSTTSFGVFSGTPKNSVYTNVLQGLESARINSVRSGTYQGLTWTLSAGTEANNWDLTFTGTNTYVMSSLNQTAATLQNIYALQNSVLANSFTYDCAVFDVNNVCVSVGGRNVSVSAASGLHNTSGLLIAAYRALSSVRIGAYADQNLSVKNGGIVNLRNRTPLIGLFGVWNENLDGTGAEVKVTVAYGQKNATITRAVVSTSEAGSGSSQLNSQGAQVIIKYGFGIADEATVSSYAGLRYTQNNMDGYTEGTSSTVTAPLSYNAVNTNATTVLVGMSAAYRIIPQAVVFANAGIESDANTTNGTYSATGVAGLTAVNFNANPVKTRPTASVGAIYDTEKNQRLAITGIYRKEAYQGASTSAVMATYTVGW